MAVIEQLDHLLRRDFTAATNICKDSTGLRCISPGKLVHYEFQPDYIIRTSGITDTFKVKNEGINMMFEGRDLSEITSSSQEADLLDELEFNLIYQNENIPYHYHKQYSSVNLFQENPDANH